MQKQRTKRPAAIIIGLDSLQGLQAARILSARGIPVYALAADRRHPACKTNVCEQILFVDTQSNQLIRALQRLRRNLPTRPVLFPCQDKSVVLLSRHRRALQPDFAMSLPSERVVEILADKMQFYTYARKRGLPIPDTFILRNRDDALEAAEAARVPRRSETVIPLEDVGPTHDEKGVSSG